ncbi:MAG TPA: PLP-dependent aminotransferase family protein [Anaerolineales bacterium]|nr:PLP-dependent aminotransferase family protein [Anaerolineales bacterium]
MRNSLQTVQISVPPDVIDLGRGDPGLSLLPLDLLRRAAEIRFAANDPSFLQYGTEQGDGFFRLALAQFLSKGYGFSVDPDELFVTNGISNALDQICTLFTQPGDTVFVEEPSYFLALRIFADHHLRVVSIETDENGLIPASLRDRLAESRPKFLYLIPTFQNPTGHTLTQERRDELVALSREYDFMLIADEVYHFLNYTQRPPKPFAAYNNSSKVISLGSFSKILAPGLRLGWVQAHPETLKQLINCGLLDSGGGLNPFTSAIIRGAVESGDLEQNISKLVNTYRERVAFMDSCLRKYIPELSYAIPHGGYFFWARLPSNLDAAELQKKAEPFKVNFRAGVRFSSQDRLKDYMRLCFVFYEPNQIEDGIKRLNQCLKAL